MIETQKKTKNFNNKNNSKTYTHTINDKIIDIFNTIKKSMII